jgi:hypothetical protein
MTDRMSHGKFMRTASLSALLLLGFALTGCAQMSDGMSTAFADPAKYDFYDCPQLEKERKALDARSTELKGLMAKADTGFAGPVVAEMAYRNDYIAVRGQARFAEEAWQRNKCRETPPAPAKMAMPAAQAKMAAPAGPAKKGAKPRSGTDVY